MSELNLGNSLFEGRNDQEGIMICGYEWGHEGDKNAPVIEPDMSKECTFSNKSLRYGEVAKTWIKYDKRIRTWFSIVKLLYYPYRIRKKLEIIHRLSRSTILYAYV